MKLQLQDTVIKVDQEGFYCINDLHKAAGGEKKNQPSNFFRSQQTIDLVEEILITRKRGIKKSSGRYGGTFICKELVYAYAMWVSPAFHLKVIQAYDKQQSVKGQLDTLVNDVREKATSISEAVNLTTGALAEIKKHGSAWGAYGSSIKAAKREAVNQLEQLKQEVQMKLDFLES